MTIKIHDGQTYRQVGSQPHVRKDGSHTTLTRWQSHCSDCGAEFSFLSPSEAEKFVPNRRCEKHRKPGQKVKS